MVFGLEFKSNFGKAIAWFLVLLVITGLLMAFYPLVHEDNILSLVEGFRDSFSDNLKHILGLSSEIDFRNLGEYLPFIYQYLSIFFAIFAIQLGARSLVKEQSAGTIEYIYSQPISRGQILSGKFFANFLIYILVLICTLASSLGFAYIFGAKYFVLGNLIYSLSFIFFLLLLLGFCFLCIGYFYSALSNRVSHVDGGSLLIVFFLLIGWIILSLLGQGDVAAFLPFDAFNPLSSLKESIDLMAILADLVVGVFLFIIGIIIYNSKELKF